MPFSRHPSKLYPKTPQTHICITVTTYRCKHNSQRILKQCIEFIQILYSSEALHGGHNAVHFINTAFRNLYLHDVRNN